MRKGRFNKPAAQIAQRYGESVSFDHRLCCYDIAGSIVHATALVQAGIISANELKKLSLNYTQLRKRSSPANSNGTALSKTCT